MILRELVLGPRFDIMVMLAQGLPVVLIPEEHRVSSVRLDVVHHRGLDVPAFALARCAQRVGTKESSRQPAPAGAVATSRSGPDLFRVLSHVLVTVFLSLRHQLGAAGMPAGMIREVRHHRHHLSNRKGQSRFPGPDLGFFAS